MPLVICLQDENGNRLKKVFDQKGDLNALLPPLTDRSHFCFRFIDPYAGWENGDRLLFSHASRTDLRLCCGDEDGTRKLVEK